MTRSAGSCSDHGHPRPPRFNSPESPPPSQTWRMRTGTLSRPVKSATHDASGGAGCLPALVCGRLSPRRPTPDACAKPPCATSVPSPSTRRGLAQRSPHVLPDRAFWNAETFDRYTQRSTRPAHRWLSVSLGPAPSRRRLGRSSREKAKQAAPPSSAGRGGFSSAGAVKQIRFCTQRNDILSSRARQPSQR